MSDLAQEYFPLTQAGRNAPPGLERLHAKTWMRWALRGVGSPRVKLRTWKLGGRRYTNRHAIEQFLAELNPRTNPAASDPVRSHDQAEHELLAEGF
jgi:hypothetical protein